MIVIAAVDDKYGMMFNQRRISQDRALRKYIVELVGADQSRLWMNAYTRKQFRDLTDETEALLVVDEEFINKVPEGEFCFVENVSVRQYQERVEEVILCLWNRRYPADTYWDLNMENWKLTSSEEIVGSSHEKITINTYTK